MPLDAAASSRDSNDCPPGRRAPIPSAFRPVVAAKTPLLWSVRRALSVAASASCPALRGDVREDEGGVRTSSGSPDGAKFGGPPSGVRCVIGALHVGHPLPGSGLMIAACVMYELARVMLARWRYSG